MKKIIFTICVIVCLLRVNAQGQPAIPTTLGELNNFDLSFTDLNDTFDIKASTPLFTLTASRKNHNVVLNFLKYKDILVDGTNVRVFVGMQLFIASYNYAYSGSISPAAISAAATLGKTKATFDLKIYGLPIDYVKLPKSGSFNADTFAQIEKAFDDIISSLKETTIIDPTVVKFKATDNTAIFKTMNFSGTNGVATSSNRNFDPQKVKALL